MTKPAPSPLDAIFTRDAEGQTQMTTTTPDHIVGVNKKVPIPSELIKAAEDVLELFLRVWISDDGINLTPEEKGKLNALRIELNKFK